MSNLCVIITAIVFSVINSCNVKNEKNYNTYIKRWIGKKVIIPADTLDIKIISKTTFNYSDIFNPDNIKLIVSINVDCGAFIYKLRAVEEFADEIFLLYENISLLIYMNSITTDFNNFKILNENEIRFKYPLIYDYKNKFLSENRFPLNDLYLILLCDKNDNILLIGDFTSNDKLKELYLNEIRIHANPIIYDYPIVPPIYKSPR